ncbi:protein-tyrosine phosphatase family protein [Catellatospora vulcania]|uniref:protein-tyrosine phosphatase family protein n=1 Tax=Catellatospora vulcania TaxID=1460450 RepID=UPI0012D4BD71|nr:tyrosine protein phosphatase [Catellatospora vulcania]
MPTTAYVIDWPAAGRLAVMPRPAGGERLPDEVDSLRRNGVDTVVCALTAPECGLLGLSGWEQAVRAAGMRFVSFPIPDFGVPDFTAYRELTGRLAEEVAAGRFVLAHCHGGVGRATVIAGGVLIRLGASAADAMAAIGAARGLPVPETEPQRAILARLAGMTGPC